MNAPAGKLALLLWAAGPDDPDRCAAPFVYAAVAAAMDCEVEIHFAGRAVRLLVPGVAEALYSNTARDKSIAAFMRDAAEHGARFLACGMALHEHVAPGEPLIADCAGRAGAAAFVQRTLDPAWRTLVF